MELRLYRTLWGVTGAPGDAAAEAVAAGFDGLEGPAPVAAADREVFGSVLAASGLDYIAEICTAGGYVPERRAGVDAHLASLERQLDACAPLAPRFVNCIGGCDAWPEADSRRFFSEAIARADDHGLTISFETHRSRSLFNPWVTARLVEAVPRLLLTCDFSHWCVVCERLMDTELDVIAAIAPRAHHIHARVGYDQGPQVPHPAAPEHAGALASHQDWWEILWRAQHARGCAVTTMTPEFGPDGYLHTLPFTGAPVADLWELNRWMAATERRHFRHFARHTLPAAAASQ